MSKEEIQLGKYKVIKLYFPWLSTSWISNQKSQNWQRGRSRFNTTKNAFCDKEKILVMYTAKYAI